MIPRSTLALLLAAAAAAPALGLELHPGLGDHAVLQRDAAVPVRGEATAGATVRVVLLGPGGPLADATAEADADGAFHATLPAQPAGGPHRLLVEELDAGGEVASSVPLDDLLFGDVWIASGQSNMGWRVNQSDDADRVAGEAIDGIRHLQVELRASPRPIARPEAAWQRTEPASTPAFSAVAHHFARRVHAEAGVPIGILHASWGGTPAGAWTPRAALLTEEATAGLVTADEAVRPADPLAEANHRRALAAWERDHAPGGPRSARQLDPGTPETRRAEAARYAAPGFDDADWAHVELPHRLEDLAPDAANVDGVAWYRNRVGLPAELTGRPLVLRLGRIDDADTAYADGVEVGRTPQSAPRAYAIDRRYPIPAEATADGELVLAVRVLDDYGGGGFTGPARRIRLEAADGSGPTLPLTAGWRADLVHPLAPLGRPYVPPPADPAARKPQDRPGFLWNGMLAGFVGTPVSGVIWYQGESDAGQAERYRTLFPLLIRSWRDAFGQPELPFLFVQLAAYRQPLGDRFDEAGWGPIRDAQAFADATVPGTGMAVILDLQDPDPMDIHPGNKTDVGHRLAGLALRDAYGKDVVAEGPRVERVEREGSAVVVTFRAAQPPLATPDGTPPGGFWLRNAGGRTRRASARIEGATVRLTAPGIEEAAEVLYAWATNPARANLSDGSGLPAAPFRLRLTRGGG